MFQAQLLVLILLNDTFCMILCYWNTWFYMHIICYISFEHSPNFFVSFREFLNLLCASVWPKNEHNRTLILWNIIEFHISMIVKRIMMKKCYLKTVTYHSFSNDTSPHRSHNRFRFFLDLLSWTCSISSYQYIVPSLWFDCLVGFYLERPFIEKCLCSFFPLTDHLVSSPHKSVVISTSNIDIPLGQSLSQDKSFTPSRYTNTLA